jgi:hypothetical protein
MSLVEDIIASQHDPDTAYAIFDNHKRGDFVPYVYKTTDRGRSWTSIGKGLPERGTAHTIAEDHVDPDLLFVGTEFGLHMTNDRGDSWEKMTGGLPVIAVRDLEIQRRENDLVIATFGRGIFILDDYSALRSDEAVLEEEAALFAVKDAWLYNPSEEWGPFGGAKGSMGDAFYSADNPPYGAVFTYHLRDGYTTKREERLADEAEKLKSGEDTPYPLWDDLEAEDREQAPEVLAVIRDREGNIVRRMSVPSSKGLHRVAWSMRHEAPDPVSLTPPSQSIFGGGAEGPMVAPGRYSVELVKRLDGEETSLTEQQEFMVKPLGRSPEAAADREALASDHLAMRDLSVLSSSASSRARELSEELKYLKAALDRTPEATRADYDRLNEARGTLSKAEEILYGDQTRGSRNEAAQIGLTSRVGTLRFSTWNAQFPVGEAHRSQMAMARKEYDAVREHLSDTEEVVEELKGRLTDLGAPWTPDRSLPALP